MEAARELLIQQQQLLQQQEQQQQEQDQGINGAGNNTWQGYGR